MLMNPTGKLIPKAGKVWTKIGNVSYVRHNRTETRFFLDNAVLRTYYYQETTGFSKFERAGKVP